MVVPFSLATVVVVLDSTGVFASVLVTVFLVVVSFVIVFVATGALVVGLPALAAAAAARATDVAVGAGLRAPVVDVDDVTVVRDVKEEVLLDVADAGLDAACREKNISLKFLILNPL